MINIVGYLIVKAHLIILSCKHNYIFGEIPEGVIIVYYTDDMDNNGNC